MSDKGRPMLAGDCPRCGQHAVTFDVLADVRVTDAYHYEVFARCRRCGDPSVALLEMSRGDSSQIAELGGKYINHDYTFQRWVFNLPGSAKCPDHVPANIAAAFNEGARSMAIGCYNASGAMFRLCLDLTTKPLLPSETDPDPKPSKRERYNLGPRIDWLVDNNKLPVAIGEMAHHVRLDGNDGVHDGSLGESDADDLIEFTIVILERHFTEPEKLRLARARQNARRGIAEPEASV